MSFLPLAHISKTNILQDPCQTNPLLTKSWLPPAARHCAESCAVCRRLNSRRQHEKPEGTGTEQNSTCSISEISSFCFANQPFYFTLPSYTQSSSQRAHFPPAAGQLSYKQKHCWVQVPAQCQSPLLDLDAEQRWWPNPADTECGSLVTSWVHATEQLPTNKGEGETQYPSSHMTEKAPATKKGNSHQFCTHWSPSTYLLLISSSSESASFAPTWFPS